MRYNRTVDDYRCYKRDFKIIKKIGSSALKCAILVLELTNSHNQKRKQAMSKLKHLQNELAQYFVDAYIFGRVEIGPKFHVVGLPELSKMIDSATIMMKFRNCVHFIVETDETGAIEVTGVIFDDVDSMSVAAKKIREAVERTADSEVFTPKLPVKDRMNAGTDYSPAAVIALRRENPGVVLVFQDKKQLH